MNEPVVFAERCGRNHSVNYQCRQVVFSGRSEYQSIDFVDTLEYGRMLFLDGVAQSSERDERIYHELMVHPALLTHPHPTSVCVIGGSEGATIREIFKHPEVRRVVMVDIDEQLVGLCRQHLPHYSAGAYDDPRLTLLFTDGRAFLEKTDQKFDVILVDLSDPVPDSPSVMLFTREFYQTVFNRLEPDGVACFQGESLQPWRVELHARMVNTLAAVFPVVTAYPYALPCFHEIHAFILASRQEDPRRMNMGQKLADKNLDLVYLSPTFLPGLFFIPGYVEKAYGRYTEILTDAKPLVVSGYRFIEKE
ncbi:MAG: fused MFS/spermidine synthase [Thermodesulfobacteriota bacterium]